MRWIFHLVACAQSGIYSEAERFTSGDQICQICKNGVAGFRGENGVDWAGYYSTLLDNEPPTTTKLQAEGSGCGLLSVYIERTVAEYTPLISSDADATFLRGLEDNLLKIASDYY